MAKCPIHGNRKIETMIDWQPITTAPWNKEVLLTGDSGYTVPRDHFIINGYRQKGWHSGQWNDIAGEPLAYCGWVPTHWAKLPNLPETA